MAYCAPLPTAKPSVSYWQKQGANLHASTISRALDSLPETCDVAIIGGGFSGIATAYHLLKSTANPPKELLLLDAREICSGATGRNGGHLRPDLLMNPFKIAKRCNFKAALELIKFELGHIETIRDLIREERIDCDFAETTNMTVMTSSEQIEQVQEAYASLLSNLPAEGSSLLQNNLDMYLAPDGPLHTGVIGTKGYYTMPAARLSAYKFVMSLFSKCLDMGLSYKSNTPVLSVQHSDKDGSWTLTTESGQKVKAQKIIYATNAYTSHLLPEYGESITPCKGFACHIASAEEGDTLPQLLTSSFVSMHRNPETQGSGIDYLIQLDDRSIVVGGAHHVYRKENLGGWYRNADDGESITEAEEHFSRDYMQSKFMGWQDTKAKLHEKWTGVMGYSADSLPHVGHVPGNDNAFILAGFNGHGMPLIYQAARGIASMVADATAYDKSGLPAVFETTAFRLHSTQDDILAGKGIPHRGE